ncbi:pyridoxamine kinase [Clostridium chromiireducens]|uniref:pyridoxal kinase n=1 Tax=Clostridium chromiireducens TaxID=225345 RepID=A0A399INB1_9CLOT|nr:pyridoxamine kinase [Clostridium chromiireducens]RII34510.1 pyridoxamine kinase [Clostridium chromiireducens]
MKKPIKRVAAIHDLCGIGKAALTNVIPVLATLGVEVCPVPTMILSTHTGGFGTPRILKLDGYINKAIEHYRSIDITFEGVFIGYLGNESCVNEVITSLEYLNNDNPLIIFDPIFGDDGHYYSNFDKNYAERLKEIMCYSDIITPNFTEACILADEDVKNDGNKDDILMISRKLRKLGSKDIVITSIPMPDRSKIGTAIYDWKKDSIEIIVSDRLDRSYPGTGDVFTSVLLGMLLKGNSLLESAKMSCEFVEKAIIESKRFDYPTKEGLLLEYALKYLY